MPPKAKHGELAPKKAKKEIGGNAKCDQAWFEAVTDDLFPPDTKSKPDGFLYEVNWMWNGYAEEVNADFFESFLRYPNGARCNGTSYIRDPSGMYIVDLEWIRLTRPCLRHPSRGTTVCTAHGARIPAVVSAAKQRLAEAADVVSTRLIQMTDVRDEEKVRIRPQDRITAMGQVLDRAGVKGGVEVEINASGFQGVLTDLFGKEEADDASDS